MSSLIHTPTWALFFRAQVELGRVIHPSVLARVDVTSHKFLVLLNTEDNVSVMDLYSNDKTDYPSLTDFCWSLQDDTYYYIVTNAELYSAKNTHVLNYPKHLEAYLWRLYQMKS